MYTRHYLLECKNGPKMNRFKIIATQGKTFEQLMKSYNVKIPGFVSASDDFSDNDKWEITTNWETKDHYLEAMKNPYRKMFWNRFEMEAMKHDINMVMTASDGEVWEPFADLF